MENKKTVLDDQIGGLGLMIVFTIVWAILSEYFFNNSDHKVVLLVFGFITSYLIYTYFKFIKRNKLLPPLTIEKNTKKEKWFYTVFALEGIAIFIVKNILINIDRDNLFFSSFALIVGLHFIPLAKIFNRKFDYYIGTWTTIVAILGLTLIITNQFEYKIVNAFVCAACAISTTMYGIKKVIDGNDYLESVNKVAPSNYRF